MSDPTPIEDILDYDDHIPPGGWRRAGTYELEEFHPPQPTENLPNLNGQPINVTGLLAPIYAPGSISLAQVRRDTNMPLFGFNDRGTALFHLPSWKEARNLATQAEQDALRYALTLPDP